MQGGRVGEQTTKPWQWAVVVGDVRVFGKIQPPPQWAHHKEKPPSNFGLEYTPSNAEPHPKGCCCRLC